MTFSNTFSCSVILPMFVFPVAFSFLSEVSQLEFSTHLPHVQSLFNMCLTVSFFKLTISAISGKFNNLSSQTVSLIFSMFSLDFNRDGQMRHSFTFHFIQSFHRLYHSKIHAWHNIITVETFCEHLFSISQETLDWSAIRFSSESRIQ